MSEDDNQNPPRPPTPKVVRPPPPQIDPNRREVLDTLTETEFAYLLAKLKPILTKINASMMNPNPYMNPNLSLQPTTFPNPTQRRRRFPPPPTTDEDFYRNNPYFNPHIESVEWLERFFGLNREDVNQFPFLFPTAQNPNRRDPLDILGELLDLPKFRKFLDGLFGFVVKKMPPDWFEE